MSEVKIVWSLKQSYSKVQCVLYIIGKHLEEKHEEEKERMGLDY